MSGDKQHGIVVNPTFPWYLQKPEKINLDTLLSALDIYSCAYIIGMLGVAVAEFITGLAHVIVFFCS